MRNLQKSAPSLSHFGGSVSSLRSPDGERFSSISTLFVSGATVHWGVFVVSGAFVHAGALVVTVGFLVVSAGFMVSIAGGFVVLAGFSVSGVIVHSGDLVVSGLGRAVPTVDTEVKA